MALDFPSSPTDGQIYDNYYWDDTNSRWQLLGSALEVPANFSNTATGTYTDGYDYKYVSFTSDGTLTVTRGGYADVLLVGGGGAGGHGEGGGGGAGGMLEITNAYLPAGSLDVIVGDGGAPIQSGTSGFRLYPGNNGEPSVLWKYVAPGGGGGGSALYESSGSRIYTDAFSGGSGGGGGGGGSTGGAGLTNLGNSGGAGSSNSEGGGGCGAGAAGQTAPSTSQGGNGGIGRQSSITGSAVYYAGGGGGASDTTAGTGGNGGGGGGSTGASNATSGTANTGGGGGGYPSSTGSLFAGSGGSGIVIVRVRTN